MGHHGALQPKKNKQSVQICEEILCKTSFAGGFSLEDIGRSLFGWCQWMFTTGSSSPPVITSPTGSQGSETSGTPCCKWEAPGACKNCLCCFFQISTGHPRSLTERFFCFSEDQHRYSHRSPRIITTCFFRFFSLISATITLRRSLQHFFGFRDLIQSNKNLCSFNGRNHSFPGTEVRHVSTHFRIASLIAVEFQWISPCGIYYRYMRRVFLQPFEGKLYFTDADINYMCPIWFWNSRSYTTLQYPNLLKKKYGSSISNVRHQ